MSRTIPYPSYWDDMPVDLSFVFRNEAPAGRHGFVEAAGSHLRFADGAPARFWGVNFNGGACFPDAEHAEKTARRLAKTGVNIVRFHQLDAEWNTPNIFAFSKGERIGSTLDLHPESMKRFDYLIACLKKEGIYCYLDMNTYRNFKSGDGVENAFALKDAADPYCFYNRRMIELQKKYAYDLWTHVNPHTGLAYKDDPVFAMSEIINERDFFAHDRLKVEPYVSEFRALLAAYCEQKGIAFDAKTCDVNENVEPLLSCKLEIMENFFREMYGFMREIGVKIPITGTNWYQNGVVTKSVYDTGDYMDAHPYFYDWRWGEFEKRCENKALTHSPELSLCSVAGLRALDKPLFVSEWDMPWPNEYRAESSVLYAAIGALQGWDGWAIHTYAYGPRLDNMKIIGKEVSSASIGGVPYREGIFSAWNDPAKYGLFYHAALIARRGDVREADTSVAVKVDELMGPMPAACKRQYEINKVGVFFDEPPKGAQRVLSQNEALFDEKTGEIRSETGELYRSWTKNYGTVDSPRTKCAYGFLAKNGEVALNGLSVKAETDFAVCALSSLTDEPIEKSDNMLLTTVGRAFNTNAKFDGDKLLDYGEPPILVEVVEAELSIATERSDLKVWAVNAEGMFTGCVPSTWRDGVLRFALGKTMASMYYLIQAE